MTPQSRRENPDRSWVAWAVVGAVALALCAVVIVVLGGASNDSTAAPSPGTGLSADGQAIYEQSCANCHAVDGSGAIGPKLSDGRLARRHPDPADQVQIVDEGRLEAGMPPFGGQLTDEQIQAVVDYANSL